MRPTAVGRYEAREIPPGIWSVRVFLEGYALENVKDVAIEATPRPAPLEVRLHRAEKRTLRSPGDLPTARRRTSASPRRTGSVP